MFPRWLQDVHVNVADMAFIYAMGCVLLNFVIFCVARSMVYFMASAAWRVMMRTGAYAMVSMIGCAVENVDVRIHEDG